MRSCWLLYSVHWTQASTPIHFYCNILQYTIEMTYLDLTRVFAVKYWTVDRIAVRIPKFSCPVMGAFTRSTGSPLLLRGEGPRKGPTGGSESAREAISSPLNEARKPSLNVLMRLRDQPWNYLGRILRMEEHHLTRQVLLICVKSTRESLFW